MDSSGMQARILDGLSVARSYEDKNLQARALSTIPLDRLKASAATTTVGDARERLLRELLRWFKTDFFCWVDAPPCESCGGATNSIGSASPTMFEQQRGGGRVEVYRCAACGQLTRFVRYRSAGTLLETRRGRCGEWANCFTLCCRALGYEARYVLDWTDHVWTEVWLDSYQRWIHLDPCENAFDKPLLYEVGWNKKLSYVIACAYDHVADVSLRYTRSFPSLLPRRTALSETLLAMNICQINAQAQRGIPRQRLQVLFFRALLEAKDLSQSRTAHSDEAVGRVSGSLDWRSQRGETGGTSAPLIDVDSLIHDWNSQEGSLAQAALVGTASRDSSNAVVLTPRRTDCVGAAWTPVALPISRGFVATFDFEVRGSGADGFAFVVQNESSGSGALGRGGAELGFGGMSNSVAVEFDSYQNSDACDDPNGNHISVQLGGNAHTSASAGLATTVPSLRSEGGHSCRVYCGPGKKGGKEGVLVVQMRPRGRQDVPWETYLEVAPFEIGTKIRLGDGTSAFVGFTAATGGLAQEHVIFNCIISTPTGL